jgi:hypothetical protein
MGRPQRSVGAMAVTTLQSEHFVRGSIFFFHVLAFAGLARLAFSVHSTQLFDFLDGAYYLVMARQQWEWLPLQLGLTNNFFQSIGNVWFPVNTRLLPAFLLSSSATTGETDRVLAYVVFALELFLATFALGWSLRIGFSTALLAAWLLPVLALPFFATSVIDVVLRLAPNFATSVATGALILALFCRVGSAGRLLSALLSVGIFLLVTYSVVSLPTFVSTMLPSVALLCGASVVGAHSRAEALAKACSALSILGAIWLTGQVAFLAGLFQYTAAASLGPELFNDRADLRFVSLAFEGSLYGPIGPAFVALALLGAGQSVLSCKGLSRTIAAALLVAYGLLLSFGSLTVVVDFWRGPSPLYLEFYLWPLYAIYSADVVIRIVGRSMAAMRARTQHRRLELLNVGRGWTFGIPALAWGVVSAAMLVFPEVERNWSFPPAATPITSVLESEIRLTPGQPFRGRVATFTGQGIDHPVDWMELHFNDYTLMRSTGNEYRLVGLWYFDIPTLYEYSSLITPPFYVLNRDFFARAGDRQMRSVFVLRNPVPRILRALGVRFIISDGPPPEHAQLRVEQQVADKAGLSLYELQGVNLGNYSPVEVVQATDISTAMATLERPEFDLTRSTIMDVVPTDPLVPIESSTMLVERDGLHVTAESPGASLLVLPVEFSHCLRFEHFPDSDASAQLLRANVAESALAFHGRVDAIVSYFNGPLDGADCRLKDANDMIRLRIREELRTQNARAWQTARHDRRL